MDKYFQELLKHCNITYKIADCEFVEKFIMNKLKFNGSKIAWENYYHHSHCIINNDDSIRNFLTNINFKGDFYYVGDNLTSMCYEFNENYLNDLLIVLYSNIHQHHYILSKRYDWIICMTMEGDLDYAMLLEM